MGKLFLDVIRTKETRNRVLFTMLIFLVYRLGAALPAPNIDSEVIAQGLGDASLSNVLNLVGGGSLQTFSVFALGVGPYITSSIIIQLLSMDVIPALTELAKSGEQGKQTLEKYTRYLSVVLAFFQSMVMLYVYDESYSILLNGSWVNYFYTAMVMSAGSMFLAWLGDQISAKGIGNGISMIIFAGIVAQQPFMFQSIYEQLITEASADTMFTGVLNFSLYLLVFLAIVVLVIYMNEAVRKIPIQYSTSSLTRGRDMNHLPLKINSASVMPVIFASAVMAAPLTILSFIKSASSTYTTLETFLSPNKPIGLAIYLLLVVLFTFYYTNLQVDPEKLAENLGKNGSYIPGIRPGNETKNYIRKVLNRITVLGALFLVFVAALPYLLPMFTNIPETSAIGGTGIIIVVGVALETMKDLESRMTQKSYKGFINK